MPEISIKPRKPESAEIENILTLSELLDQQSTLRLRIGLLMEKLSSETNGFKLDIISREIVANAKELTFVNGEVERMEKENKPDELDAALEAYRLKLESRRPPTLIPKTHIWFSEF